MKKNRQSITTISGKKVFGTGRGWYRSRGDRHLAIDVIALRKRRAKNKVARATRQAQRRGQ